MLYRTAMKRVLFLKSLSSGLGAVLLAFLTVPLASAQTNCVSVPNEVVGWWPGDGGANDLSGLGNDGALKNSVGFVPGEVGNAFSFNGSTSYIEVPDSASLRITNVMSIEFWVKRLRVDGSSEYILEKGGDWLLNQQSYAVQLHGGDDGLCLTWAQGYRIAGVISDTNAWHHCAVVATNGAQDALFFIDGVQQPITQSYGDTISFTPSALPLHIGAQVSSSATYYGATEIDELTIYNAALSAAQIQAIYNAGPAGKCQALMITAQPADQAAVVGGTADFTVKAFGSPPLNYQWRGPAGSINGATSSSLTLTNVQLNDSGVYSVTVSNSLGSVTSSNATLSVFTAPPCLVTGNTGVVSWWRGEGDLTDASGAKHNGTLHNSVFYTTGKVGQALGFNGVDSYVEVPDDPSLELTSVLTIEFWVKRLRVDGHPEYIVEKGGDWTRGGQNYAVQLHGGDNSLCLTWNAGYQMAGAITDTNTWHHCAVIATNGAPTAVFFIDGTLQTISQSAGASVQLTPSTLPLHIGAQVDSSGLNYYGNTAIDELTIYDRALSPDEIQAIYKAGFGGKCVNPAPPSFVLPVQSQSVLIGSSVSFNAVAAGALPLSYQWQFNGHDIAGATSNSLTLLAVAMTNSGSYTLAVSNAAGMLTSGPAALTVTFPPATIATGDPAIANDGTVSVPITIIANGNENAASFSLIFKTNLLQYQSVVTGNGAMNSSLLVNAAAAATGKLGVAIALPSGTALSAGTQQLAIVNFSSPILTSSASASLAFGDTPIKRLLADAAGNPLAANFQSASFTIPTTLLEGDVYPRPNGDADLTINDWVTVGRYVAALDSPTNRLEFQRADCAPRATLGDGAVTVSDWVQAGRYAAALDPVTRLGGPTAPVPQSVTSPGTPLPRPKSGSNARQLSLLTPVLTEGVSGAVQIALTAQGNENALAFSLVFDPAQLVFVGASSAAASATLNVNPNQAAQGRLGFALALSPGSTFATGEVQLVNVSFRPVGLTGSAPLSFGDQPVIRGVADATANVLTADYLNNALTIAPVPSINIGRSTNGVTLSWPLSSTGFVLQESSDSALSRTNWTTLIVAPAVSNNQNVVSIALPQAQRFYRLYHP
jgi:hypothetical protein